MIISTPDLCSLLVVYASPLDVQHVPLFVRQLRAASLLLPFTVGRGCGGAGQLRLLNLK